ncbi:dienelactone hydrolase family protein [Paucibacter sp. APW11]|uniref:Dienelactone hydrolase family protein n=1 Tax=Roseateles aquae TaxID=3077235 RepID=A0ABU3PG78_9BURK|nr:dienelactone hydrolase family protein [Paucibacter sp. APW11]MDT9001385.1 dienelactone hydrolase family protein [Paucibacter sp. APW11]
MSPRLRLALLSLGFALGFALPVHAQASELELTVPSLEQRAGHALALRAHWFAADATATRRPALVLLHGCGGAYQGSGRLSARMTEMAGLLNAQGWHVLVLDSFGARGEKSICTQRIGTRAITMANRRLDALGALQWLATRPEVDASRLALIGWSNGGSTVLAASDLNVAAVRQGPRPRALVAFYPGCAAELARHYRPSAALLMLLGEDDDWTPAADCKALAAASADPKPEWESYAGAYHGFDGPPPVKLRKDVPNGAHPGAGVHVGGQPQAAEQSRKRLLNFLHTQLD